MILFPRVPKSKELQLVTDATSFTEDAPQITQELLDSMDFTMTGGTRVKPPQLLELRKHVVEVAVSHGFPYRELNKKDKGTVDAALTRAFCQSTVVEVGEASLPGTWVFFSAVLFPHVINWRWPGASLEHVWGGRRNMFYRYWYLYSVLADNASENPFWLIDLFGVDNLVQIAERPFLAGCLPVVLSLARAMAPELKKESNKFSDQLLVRDVMLRAQRTGAILSLQSYTEAEAKPFAVEVVRQSVAELTERSKQSH